MLKNAKVSLLIVTGLSSLDEEEDSERQEQQQQQKQEEKAGDEARLAQWLRAASDICEKCFR